MAQEREYLLVDGYNIINAWPELNKIKGEYFEDARLKLIEILLNYQGVKNNFIILVFDAHQVKGGIEHRDSLPGLEVVYTKEGETADVFIERLAACLAGQFRVYVATSDWVEQSVSWQKGALRISARELREEITLTQARTMEVVETRELGFGSVNSHLPDRVREKLEKWRRGKE